MALISCPECGKEISDKAITCPNCGIPLEEALKELEYTKDIDYVIDADTTKCKACANCGSIYTDPADEGYRKGYCIECRDKRLYDKLIKIDYSIKDFNDLTEYSPSYRMAAKKMLFVKYVQDWESLDKESITYKLNIENLFNGGKGEIHDRLAAEMKQSNIPTCPTCGSTSIKRISDKSRGMSVLFFGLASGKIGKTFECRNCGYRW